MQQKRKDYRKENKEICKKIKKVFLPQKDLLTMITSIGVSIKHPIGGGLIQLWKPLLEMSNQIYLNYIYKGLFRGVNEEKKINQLYNYICNEERALFVVNSFRKTMLGNSRIASVIMGLMLSEISEKDRDIALEDSIIANALDGAADFDFLNYYEICREYVIEDGWIRLDSIEKTEKYHELYVTEEYFVQRRVFLQEHDIIPGSEKLGDAYARTTVQSEKLMNYVEKAKQILRYTC